MAEASLAALSDAECEVLSDQVYELAKAIEDEYQAVVRHRGAR